MDKSEGLVIINVWAKCGQWTTKPSTAFRVILNKITEQQINYYNRLEILQELFHIIHTFELKNNLECMHFFVQSPYTTANLFVLWFKFSTLDETVVFSSE